MNTARLPNVPVQLEELVVACSIMQAVNILSHQGKINEIFLEVTNRIMARVRFNLNKLTSPPTIPLPNQPWIGLKRFRRGQFLHTEFLP